MEKNNNCILHMISLVGCCCFRFLLLDMTDKQLLTMLIILLRKSVVT